MTGIEVENWTQNKKSHLTDHVKGEFSTIKNRSWKFEKLWRWQEKIYLLTSPWTSKLFAQTVRNGIKNVHYLPTETNLSFKKINIEELGKAFESNPYKFLKDTANHNNVMSTIATSGSCDHLKGKSNVLVIQKPGFNCKSFQILWTATCQIVIRVYTMKVINQKIPRNYSK